MIKSRKRQEGLKLIELLLVMAIGGGVLYLSIRQYLSYRLYADVAQVQSNVDLIYQAMAGYFRANCGISGHPLNRNFPDISFAVSITALQNAGYFYGQKLMSSPLISQTTPDEGYILQFNQVQPLQDRQISIVTSPPQTPPKKINVGKILIWNAQVSVLLKTTTLTKEYAALLQANCLSIIDSAGGAVIVAPCTGAVAPPSARYAVWMRLPSFSSSRVNSPYWVSMPIVQQFKQRYTTFPLIIVDDESFYADQQFFVCGT